MSGTPSCSGRDNYGLRASPQLLPVYNKYLTSDLTSDITSDPTSDLQSGPGKAHNKNSTPYFLKSRLPMYGTKDTRLSLTKFRSQLSCFLPENTRIFQELFHPPQIQLSLFGNTRQISFLMLRTRVSMTQVSY